MTDGVNSSSPFGQYASIVAVVAAVVLVGGYVLAVLVGPAGADDKLAPLVYVAVGAIFGSAIVTNGWKAPVTAAHVRVDRLTQAVAAIAAQAKDVDASSVTDLIEPPAGPTSSSTPA